jgi:hypothetical protein
MTDCKKKPGKDRANLRDMNSDSEHVSIRQSRRKSFDFEKPKRRRSFARGIALDQFSQRHGHRFGNVLSMSTLRWSR